MKKTSIQKKLYEVPSLKEHPLTTRKFFAVSPDGYNPGGYVPDMEDGGDI